MSDGYYLNSLREWKSNMQRHHRQLMSRYAALERSGHPSKMAQGKLIDLNTYFLEILSDRIAKAELE